MLCTSCASLCLQRVIACYVPACPSAGAYPALPVLELDNPPDALPSSVSSSDCVMQLAFVGMTSESYDQIRVWLQYHQSVGVSIFYLFVDGQAARPEVQAQLALLPGVTVIPRDEQLVDRQAHSRIWNETWLAAFFHKPCNHELFVRQSLNMESEYP